jgi:hypothetical protein
VRYKDKEAKKTKEREIMNAARVKAHKLCATLELDILFTKRMSLGRQRILLNIPVYFYFKPLLSRNKRCMKKKRKKKKERKERKEKKTWYAFIKNPMRLREKKDKAIRPYQ